MQFLRNFFLITTLLFAPAAFVHAAVLSVDPQAGAFGPGDTFVLTVHLDLEVDECVNAATVELMYPNDWMKASAVSKGESVLTLWPGEPTVDHEHGIINFSGGIPAGYCGRIQGDPGKTNILAKIVFSIPGNMIGGKIAEGDVPLMLTLGPNSQVLQNDGFGTPTPLTFVGGTYVRTLTATGAPNEWLALVHEDKTPPDAFGVAITQDPKTFQGKYFLAFSTVDKQSGVHHFEVVEDDPQNFGMVRGEKFEKALSINATSPYVLRDQALKSRIIVRAVDHAGNIEETILPPNGVLTIAGDTKSGGAISHLWWYALVVLALLALLAVVVLVARKQSETPVDV